jgi:hypothetical protein
MAAFKEAPSESRDQRLTAGAHCYLKTLPEDIDSSLAERFPADADRGLDNKGVAYKRRNEQG